jgi:hypothetical protein
VTDPELATTTARTCSHLHVWHKLHWQTRRGCVYVGVLARWCKPSPFLSAGSAQHPGAADSYLRRGRPKTPGIAIRRRIAAASRLVAGTWSDLLSADRTFRKDVALRVLTAIAVRALLSYLLFAPSI